MKTIRTRLNNKISISTKLIDGVWETATFRDSELHVDMKYAKTEKQAINNHIKAIKEYV